MSYEHKEAITEDIGPEPNCNYPNEVEGYYSKLKELDEVYRKAKAFDAIFRLYIGYEDGWIHFPKGIKSFNKEIINVCKYYESGEYDGKPRQTD